MTGAARANGIDAQIIDLNLEWHRNPALRDNFYHEAANLVCESDADIYGFTSMVVDSHVALEVARLIKARRPEARVILGGTHFSQIASSVKAMAPWVNSVISGEGERRIDHLVGDPNPEHAFMHPSATESDYMYADLPGYFALNARHVVDVESERGCRFKCAFCYSPVQYPQRRTFKIDRFVAELAYLAGQGTKHVFIVDDNVLNDRLRAMDVCAALREARLGLTWHCYATFPQIDVDMLRLMSQAGCTALFTGIDAVGITSQRTYKKRFIRSEDLVLRKVAECLDFGITPTCAFLVAPPSHPCGLDVDGTLEMALSLRGVGANVRLNMLTYYTGTPLAESCSLPMMPDHYRSQIQLDLPEPTEHNPYAAQAPALFPFHARYTEEKEWAHFVQQMHCAFTLMHARCDELLPMTANRRPLLPVIDEVLAQTGDIQLIEKTQRRASQVSAFDSLSC